MTISENTMTPPVVSYLHGAKLLTTAELIRLTQELFKLCFQRLSADLSSNNQECLQQMSIALNGSVANGEGNLKPTKQNSLLATLATLEPIEEDFPDFDEGLLPLDDIIL